MDIRKKRLVILIEILAVALVALGLALLFFLRVAPEGTSPQPPANVSVPLDDWESESPDDVEGEVLVDPGSGSMPTLDLEGIMPASGEFNLQSVPNGIDFVLSEKADEFAAIIEAIKSVDPAFNQTGYKVNARATTTGGSNGDVAATLYIGDIKTSSCYTVAIDNGAVKYVFTMWAHHPNVVAMEQLVKLREDFDASPKKSESIKGVVPSSFNLGLPQAKYSEEYFYSFEDDKLYLAVRCSYLQRGDVGVVVANEERIDVQEVMQG